MEDKTENQEPQGTPLIPEETSDWGNTVRFVEPGEEVKEEPTEDGPVEETPEEEIPEPEYEPAPPAVADPGDFTPGDYSFDVVVYDGEGKNPKTVKVEKPEDFDKLLEDDANFGTSAALMKATRLASKMEVGLERDKNEWQKKKDEFDKDAGARAEQQQTVQNIAAEITYLVSKGKLPKVEKQYEDADWSNPEVAKQPGVKEQLELLSYMRKENASRKKAGLQPLNSALDAYNAMQLDQRDKKAKEAQKAAGEARKAAGARVAGNTPAPVTNVPKGIAVGRGGSLRDINAGW